jgi:acyl carrier protein
MSVASATSATSAAERDMAQLLVAALNLEGVDAAAIDPDAPLFGHDAAGLGLDSIDALEIALAVEHCAPTIATTSRCSAPCARSARTCTAAG